MCVCVGGSIFTHLCGGWTQRLKSGCVSFYVIFVSCHRQSVTFCAVYRVPSVLLF